MLPFIILSLLNMTQMLKKSKKKKNVLNIQFYKEIFRKETASGSRRTKVRKCVEVLGAQNQKKFVE